MGFTDTQQWKSAERVNAFLDAFFQAMGYTITSTSRHEERVLCLGDRWFTRDGRRLSIEYKSGIQTYYTGNVFLETVSVDTAGKPGWVYTCQSDFIVYGALLNHVVILFKPNTLRAAIEDLKAEFGVRQTRRQQNKDYNTHGVAVPLLYAQEKLAHRVLILREDGA